MSFLDLIRLIMDNLARRKGRVALTAIGVVIGTAAVVVLVSLAVGLQKSATQQLGGISDLTGIYVSPTYGDSGPGGKPGMAAVQVGGGGGGGGSGSSPTTQHLLLPEKITEIRNLPGVKTVVARDYLNGGGPLQFGRMETYASVMGVDAPDLSVLEYPLASGTTEIKRGTAIIGGWAVKNFVDPRQRPGQEAPPQPDILNQQLRLVLMKGTADGQMVQKTIYIRIVGILQETRGEPDGMLYVSMEELTAWNEWLTGTRINRNRVGYNNLMVRTTDVNDVMKVVQQINDIGFQASTPQSFVQGINSYFMVLQVIFGGIGAISLLVAAIGIANTMTMAILERTREIGLMKAVGATNRDVLMIFLGEAAGIGFLGGVGGVLLGLASGQLVNVIGSTFMAQQGSSGMGTTSLVTATPVWLPVFALLFATLVGIISGLYPALRAATLVPVIALKYE